MRTSVALALSFAVLLAAVPARADNAMAGSWTIERADAAPWSNDTEYVPYRQAMRTYVGQQVVFAPKKVKAPALLACANPHYEMKDYPAEGLFQGELGEFEQRGGGKAEETATAMGFKTRPIKTLETGCEHTIDFHMSDAAHAAFALDNMIYWLVRDAK